MLVAVMQVGIVHAPPLWVLAPTKVDITHETVLLRQRWRAYRSGSLS
jgi:hypothetical protein